MCGKIFNRLLAQSEKYNKQFCSNKCQGISQSGKNSYAYKEELTSDYRQITINGQRKQEHVFVVERQLGYELLKGWIVHHIDENKHNNLLNNLEVFETSSEHLAFHRGNPTAKPIWSGRGQEFCRNVVEGWEPAKKIVFKKVICPPEFSQMAHTTGLVLEHRLKVAKVLRRPLNKAEVVHHIDGNSQNNNITNLMLLRSKSDHLKLHRGQKVSPIFDGSQHA